MPRQDFDTSRWLPVGFATNATNAFSEAYELDRLAFRSELLALMTPPGMSEAAAQQRKAILSISIKIINAERDRMMDKAVAYWTQYRTMRPDVTP